MNSRQWRRNFLAASAGVGVWLAAGLPALAAEGGLPTNVAHTDSSPEWERLRANLFKDRPIEVTASQVLLMVPLRAA